MLHREKYNVCNCSPINGTIETRQEFVTNKANRNAVMTSGFEIFETGYGNSGLAGRIK